MRIFIISLFLSTIVLTPIIAEQNQPNIATIPLPPAQENKYNIQSFKLPNGLEVLHIPNFRAPVIMQAVCYKIGSADDAQGKSGVAHYLEHLMFRGTKNTPDGVFNKTISEIGAESNAYTQYDTTVYYQIFAKNHLERMMELEADRMQYFEPNPQAFDSEKRIIIEEYQMRVGNDKNEQLYTMTNAAFFANHPYRIPIIGWWEELEKISRDDALDYHKKYYGPNNAILVISGDIDFESTKKLAEKYYGPIPARPTIERNRTQEPKHFQETIRVELRHQTVSAQVQAIYDAPNYRTGDQKEVLALSIFEKILGHDSTGKLYQNLVMQQKIAGNVYASFNPNYHDPYSFVLVASPKTFYDYKELEYAIHVTLKKIINDEINDALVEDAKKNIVYEMDEHFSSLSNISDFIIKGLANGRSLKDMLNFHQNFAQIKTKDVQDVAQKYFKNPPRMIAAGVSLPQLESDQ
ncbi:MAG: pitrilysin family protein [Alphaproteobacteria bacterium]|nr:pitrilysin family protein [Alphaproteobacteria bacterium]